MSKLAILGGSPELKIKLKKFNTYNSKETKAANRVLKNGLLSGFVADNTKSFFGGVYVNKLEDDFRKYFKVKYAISVNSWTSGLVCSVGSLNITPGDEIIVSPWTMSASASAILAWGAIPVFSEIDHQTYCLDPSKINEKITNKTRAILVTDIFGQSANYSKILQIAKKKKLYVISDTAQSIGSSYKNLFSGTVADIGGFSFNRHKHIQAGEGGMIVTNNSSLAENIYKIRNHGEVINNDNKFPNLIGYNFRMNELEASLCIEQLKKLKKIITKKQISAKLISNGIKHLKGLAAPFIPKENTHVYYVYAMNFDEKISGIKKKILFKALQSEGLPIEDSYVNLLEYFIYKNKNIHNYYPWKLSKKKNYNYLNNNVHQNIDKLNKEKYLALSLCDYEYSPIEVKSVLNCFYKVWENLDELRKIHIND
jgi:perosamine synthetase